MGIIENISTYWSNNPIGFVIDIILMVLLGIILIVCLCRSSLKKYTFLGAIAYFAISILAFCFQLQIIPLALMATSCILLYVIVNNGGVKKPEVRNLVSQTIAKYRSKNENNDALKEQVIDSLIETVEYFSSRKIGAIITIEGNDSLEMYMKAACKIDSELTCDLLKTIFFPNTALHDGAVIIRNGRVACAAAFYTPSVNKDLPTTVGSRHRAALGISETTDAFTIVVSEETGKIKSTYRGVFSEELSEELIRNGLNEHLTIK